MKKNISLEQVKKKAAKPGVNTEYVFYRNIYRPISFYIIHSLIKTPITPNMVSLIAFIIGLTSMSLFLFKSPFMWVLGCIVYQIHQILDCVDGGLARVKNQASEKGYRIEMISSYTLKPLLPIVMSIGLFYFYNNISILFIGFLATYTVLLDDVLLLVNKGKGRQKLSLYLIKKKSKFRKIVRDFSSYLGFIVILFFAALLDLSFNTDFRLIFFILFTTYFVISVFRLVIIMLKDDSS